MRDYSDNFLFKRRVHWLQVGLIVLAGIIVSRLAWIQLFQYEHYTALASQGQQRKYEVQPRRGEVYVIDNGIKVPLALNQTLKLVYADPSIIKEDQKPVIARKLAETIEESEQVVLDKLRQKTSYVVLKSKVNSDVSARVTALKFFGIGLINQNYRVYPEGQLASQLLGFVNGEGSGQYGLEEYLNKQLSGTPGQLNAKTDTTGVPIATAENVIKPPVDGISYVLTIDRNIQAQAEKYLQEGIESVRAKSGSVVIIDPHTGAVKAMANYPTYDPNEYSKTKDYAAFTNDVVTDQFEPGSGFKVIAMAAGLDQGKVRPDTTFSDTSGCLEINSYRVCNAAGHKGGANATMTNVIRDSLNTGMIFVLRSLGPDPSKITSQGKTILYDYIVKRFGFGVRTGIEQANEAQGKVNPPKSSDVNYANMTFGQGLSVTMMQMASAVGAIANGGTLYQPYLIDQSIKADGTTSRTQPRAINDKVLSDQAARETAAMMQVVVERGSGYLSKIPGYNMAGKTGTAQIPRKDGKGYEVGKNIGTFVGFGPVEDPKFVMMVRINEPKIEGFAEVTTVPVYANISKWLLRYYAVPPSS